LLETTTLQDLSVAEIIEAAGISRPTFYFYFPSKYAVVATLLQQIFSEMFRNMQPWLSRAPGEEPTSSLRKALTRGTHLWYEHRAVIHAAHESAPISPEVGDVWFSIVEKFRLMIAEEIRAARVGNCPAPGSDPDLIASTLTWAAESLLYVSSRKLDAHLGTPEEVVEGLLTIGIPGVYGVSYVPGVVRDQG
jgi:AcrR family transcriptional regulator